MNTRTVFIRILLDVAVLGLISLSCILINKYGQPFQRGYYLDDESIQYPYKKGTIDFYGLLVIGTVVPTVVICMIEILIHQCAPRSHHMTSVPLTTSISFPGCLIAMYQFVGLHWIGMATTEIVTDIPKMMVGRLRPHFLYVCRPDVSKLNSTSGYIQIDICTGLDSHAIDAARRSFPSGHSSSAMFPVLYLALYLIYRLKPWSALRMPTFLVSCGLLNLAFYVGLTRISDYKHHWTDVMAGLMIGAAVALVLTFLFGGRVFHPRSAEETSAQEGGLEYGNPIFGRQELKSTQPF